MNRENTENKKNNIYHNNLKWHFPYRFTARVLLSKIYYSEIVQVSIIYFVHIFLH